jgi:hypothetical protein
MKGFAYSTFAKSIMRRFSKVGLNRMARLFEDIEGLGNNMTRLLDDIRGLRKNMASWELVLVSWRNSSSAAKKCWRLSLARNQLVQWWFHCSMVLWEHDFESVPHETMNSSSIFTNYVHVGFFFINSS